jgi:acylphosphatase
MRVRKHVYYSGSVQGVGFRYTARRLACDAGLTGFVKNLSDGRVEIVAEGGAEAVDRYLADVAEAMAGYISRAEALDEPPADEFDAFTVAVDR